MDRESDLGITPDFIKGSELYGKLTRAVGERAPYPDEEITRKILAAEDFYKRALNIRFLPTRVISAAQLRAQADDPRVKVTDFDPVKDLTEPAYDYESEMFNGNRWAAIQLGYRPIISVEDLFFWYPGTAIGASWTIQSDWRRLDYQFGSQQIVPATGPLLPLLSVNAYVLSSIAGGRDIPQSIFVDYTVGFQEGVIEAHHQDLIEGVRLRAFLMLIGVLGTILSQGRTNSNLSLDGLSQGRGFAAGRYGPMSGEIQLAIEREQEIRDNWLDHEQGPLFTFV